MQCESLHEVEMMYMSFQLILLALWAYSCNDNLSKFVTHCHTSSVLSSEGPEYLLNTSDLISSSFACISNSTRCNFASMSDICWLGSLWAAEKFGANVSLWVISTLSFDLSALWMAGGVFTQDFNPSNQRGHETSINSYIYSSGMNNEVSSCS